MDFQMFRERFQGSKPNGLRSSSYHQKDIEMLMSKMGSHDPFGHLKHKLWPKEGLGHYQKFWVLQLSFATKIQLHATHATANLCSCITQVAHDIQLHVTLRIHYTTCIYGLKIHVIHTYKSKCSCTLCATLLATTMQLIKI